MRHSATEALRELEPILRSIEEERSRKVRQFAQTTLWSVVVGGVASLLAAFFSWACGRLCRWGLLY